MADDKAQLWRPLLQVAAILLLSFGRMRVGSRLLDPRVVALTTAFAAAAALIVWGWQRWQKRRWFWFTEGVAVLGVFLGLAFGFREAVRLAAGG